MLFRSAAITVPAVGGVNAEPTQHLVRPVVEGHQPYEPCPPSSSWACGQLGCPSVGPTRPPTHGCGRGGTRRLAVDTSQAPSPIVHYGGRSNRTRKVCLSVEIQGAIRTTPLDTGSEVSLLPTEFLRPGTALQTDDFPVWAANNSRSLVEGEGQLSARIGVRAFFIDFLVTSQVFFLILGEGCLQELGLLWNHARGEVELIRVRYQLVDLPNGTISARRVTVQRPIVIPARSQVDVPARLVY